MFVDTNPFLFSGKVCGAMVRLSQSPIVNVTSGGGETGFFVIQEHAGMAQKEPTNRKCCRVSDALFEEDRWSHEKRQH
jgi:hypothetical protein